MSTLPGGWVIEGVFKAFAGIKMTSIHIARSYSPVAGLLPEVGVS
jgi:hypothetical protein